MTQKVEMALDFTESLQEENSFLRQEIQALKDKSIITDRTLQKKRLKFRGLPNGSESAQDLLEKVNLWLNKVLETGESTTPLGTQVYRVGASLNQRNLAPRDIIVEMAEDSIKSKIMTLARQKGHLPYQDSKILVFQDLPTEAIQIRKILKSVTEVLREANFKYCWLPNGKLSLYYKGQQLLARAEESGKNLLYTFNLEADLETHGRRRKLDNPLTPRKDSRIPVRNVT